MKLFLFSVVVLAALFKAEAGDGGGSKTKGEQLQAMIDTQCTLEFCDGVADEFLDCTFEEPEHPVMDGLDGDKTSELKTEIKAKKEEAMQKMLKCACCAKMSVKDILAAKGQQEGGSSSRPQGGIKTKGERLQAMIDTQCTLEFCDGVADETLDCTFEEPEHPVMDGLDGDKTSELKTEIKAKKEEAMQKMLKCACCAKMSAKDILAAKGQSVGRPGEGGGSRPQGDVGGRLFNYDIQEMLAEKCTPDFIQQKCSSMPADINCDRLDSMKTNTRGRRRKNLLYCGCCQD